MDKGRRRTQICVWKWNPANFISMFHTPSCFSLFVIILLFPLLSLSLSDTSKLFRYPSNYYRSVMHEVYKFSHFFCWKHEKYQLEKFTFFQMELCSVFRKTICSFHPRWWKHTWFSLFLTWQVCLKLTWQFDGNSVNTKRELQNKIWAI